MTDLHLPRYAIIELVADDPRSGEPRALERRICRVVAQDTDPDGGTPGAWLLPMVNATSCAGGLFHSRDRGVHIRFWSDDLDQARRWLAASRDQPDPIPITMPDTAFAVFEAGVRPGMTL